MTVNARTDVWSNVLMVNAKENALRATGGGQHVRRRHRARVRATLQQCGPGGWRV